MKPHNKNTGEEQSLTITTNMGDASFEKSLEMENDNAFTNQSDSDHESPYIIKKLGFNSKRGNSIRKMNSLDVLLKEDGNGDLVRKLFSSNDANYIISNNSQFKILKNLEEIMKKTKIDIRTVNSHFGIKMHNHLENHFHLSNKKALYYNMKFYFDAINDNVFDYLPLTFHIQEGLEDKEYNKFFEYFQNRNQEIQTQELKIQNENLNEKKVKRIRNIWIIKPGEITNRGIGIRVCSDLKEIQEILSKKEIHKNGKSKTYIVQQYCDRPLLYNKRKFDIRVYIMITSINGQFKGILLYYFLLIFLI